MPDMGQTAWLREARKRFGLNYANWRWKCIHCGFVGNHPGCCMQCGGKARGHDDIVMVMTWDKKVLMAFPFAEPTVPVVRPRGAGRAKRENEKPGAEQ